MNCRDFESHFISDRPEDQQALRDHAASCPECAVNLAFEDRLSEAARAVRPKAPAGAFEEVMRQYREKPPVAPVLTVPTSASWFAALAAGILLCASVFQLLSRPEAPSSDALLTSADLASAIQQENALDAASERLTSRLDDPVPAASPSPLAEEVRFLEDAITECRRALEANPRHTHLRERLLELSERRHLLLRQLSEEGRSA